MIPRSNNRLMVKIIVFPISIPISTYLRGNLKHWDLNIPAKASEPSIDPHLCPGNPGFVEARWCRTRRGSLEYSAPPK